MSERRPDRPDSRPARLWDRALRRALGTAYDPALRLPYAVYAAVGVVALALGEPAVAGAMAALAALTIYPYVRENRRYEA
jgi:Flp pilus assembly protein TadB